MIFMYSFSQSMLRPFYFSTTSFPAIWLETVASVTPEENTGSKNSVTLPVSTNPSPKNRSVVDDQDSSTLGSNKNSMSLNLSFRYDSAAINARNCCSVLPGYFSKNDGSPTNPSDVTPVEKGMIQILSLIHI